MAKRNVFFESIFQCQTSIGIRFMVCFLAKQKSGGERGVPTHGFLRSPHYPRDER
jgi:hypothetical protein